MYPRSLLSVLLTMLVLLATRSAAFAQDTVFEVKTEAGGILKIVSQLTPISINRIHSWEIILTNADGTAVSGAEIEVVGGMPLHDHGLPTEPRVTAETSSGHYLLEGMRFHMQGQWEILFNINKATGSDSAILDFEL